MCRNKISYIKVFSPFLKDTPCCVWRLTPIFRLPLRCRRQMLDARHKRLPRDIAGRPWGPRGERPVRVVLARLPDTHKARPRSASLLPSLWPENYLYVFIGSLPATAAGRARGPRVTGRPGHGTRLPRSHSVTPAHSSGVWAPISAVMETQGQSARHPEGSRGPTFPLNPLLQPLPFRGGAARQLQWLTCRLVSWLLTAHLSSAWM